MAVFRTDGIALVTGSASGVGLGAASALVEPGALAVIFADINESRALDCARAGKLTSNSSPSRDFCSSGMVIKDTACFLHFKRVPRWPWDGWISWLNHHHAVIPAMLAPLFYCQRAGIDLSINTLVILQMPAAVRYLVTVQSSNCIYGIQSLVWDAPLRASCLTPPTTTGGYENPSQSYC
ncbi:hypothetical protein P154DRAFT_539309 [Amniculicola lignicola CBS 123094]|uniref:NAD(P)-binding protein n=1 Tax=Amniculicola lignicola CBS 123094 TaxID=1392246 RepID=A0A6A5W1E6_9PLEO|nr:hypothetical protein P154DRAFT_539309 [Amniculicola lignicola CBS 123094]